jgi:hypothetical protein
MLLFQATQRLGRFITSRRRSSNLSLPPPPAHQLSLNHYLSKEILPRMDNYRLSIAHGNTFFEMEDRGLGR